MSIRKTIERLYNSKAFEQLLFRRLQRFNRQFNFELEYEAGAAGILAQHWQDILESKYEFSDVYFDFLIDEIVGELVFIVASFRVGLFKQSSIDASRKPAADIFVSAVREYAVEYVALDLAVEIIRLCFRNRRPLLPVPPPQKIVDTAAAIRENRERAHRYWSMLDLPTID